MSSTLPELLNRGNLKPLSITAFQGYVHTLSCLNGQIWDMYNLTGDHAPVLASRPQRYVARALKKPNGLYCGASVILVDGTDLIVDGVVKGKVSDSPKEMYGLSGRVVIFPDKVVLTADGKLEPMEATYTATGLRFCDGTYAEQTAKANSIVTTGAAFPFKVGDAVTIEGCTVKPANNKTPIIREISADGKTLRFYEYAFDLGEAASVTEPGAVTLKRTVPDLDFICSNENRLWGCKDDTIWACKLGDPTNWNVFDGVATDSYSVDTGTPGRFTACCSFLGYPCFFKEDHVFKVYGDRPTNFQVMGSATLGVMEGSGKSLAIAGEVLYYLSRVGITAYSGGIPQSVADAFGGVRYKNAVAGSDGSKYVVSMQDMSGTWHLFAYKDGMWYREDNLHLLATGYLGGLYGLADDGRVLLLDTPTDIPKGASIEDPVYSWAEFGDFDMSSFDGKYPVRLRLRLTAQEGTTVAAEISYDSTGEWENIGRAEAVRKTPFYLATPIRRCDHFRLRLSAIGEWRLWALEWELHDNDYVRK